MISMTWPQYLRRECDVDGLVVALTHDQTVMLATLLMRYPEPVTRGELIEEIYPDPDRTPEWPGFAVDEHIARLKHRIGAWRIFTRRGSGYRLRQFPHERWAWGARGPGGTLS